MELILKEEKHLRFIQRPKLRKSADIYMAIKLM